jgi:hypothetical protein
MAKSKFLHFHLQGEKVGRAVHMKLEPLQIMQSISSSANVSRSAAVCYLGNLLFPSQGAGVVACPANQDHAMFKSSVRWRCHVRVHPRERLNTTRPWVSEASAVLLMTTIPSISYELAV